MNIRDVILWLYDISHYMSSALSIASEKVPILPGSFITHIFFETYALPSRSPKCLCSWMLHTQLFFRIKYKKLWLLLIPGVGLRSIHRVPYPATRSLPKNSFVVRNPETRIESLITGPRSKEGRQFCVGCWNLPKSLLYLLIIINRITYTSKQFALIVTLNLQ